MHHSNFLKFSGKSLLLHQISEVLLCRSAHENNEYIYNIQTVLLHLKWRIKAFLLVFMNTPQLTQNI